MKVALINSFYSRSKPSGENSLFDQLASALTTSKVATSQIVAETDDQLRGPFSRIRLAVNVISGKGSLNPTARIREFNPDIIHVNNLFPNFESNWIKKSQFPKVITIHNYRPICAAGTLSRDGQFCDLCIKKPSSAIRFGCYRNSRLATFPMYLSRLLRIQERYLRYFQRVYVPSNRALEIFRSAGIADVNWQVIPHAVDVVPDKSQGKNSRFVFVGRLTSEKGIERILNSWPKEFDLDIIGDGDLDKRKYDQQSNVIFLGNLPRQKVIQLISSYRALIFSSSSPESALPLVALESLALGLPVITVDHNTVADAVRDGDFGRILPTDFSEEDLARNLKDVDDKYIHYSNNARAYSEKYHNFESWIQSYIASYSEVIAEWNSSKTQEEV